MKNFEPLGLKKLQFQHLLQRIVRRQTQSSSDHTDADVLNFNQHNVKANRQDLISGFDANKNHTMLEHTRRSMQTIHPGT